MRSGEHALYGRGPECARIDQIIGGLRSRCGTSLVFTGETGIGKTALLRYAMRRAEGVRVLAANGVPAEASLPFAGLHELLRPALDLLPRIPARQAAALSAGLALSPAAAVDPLAVAAGTLSLLAAAGRDAPLLVLVDDLHLLDATSRDAVLFAARRAGAESVGMVLCTSVEDGGSGLPCHRVAPLDPAAGLALLRASSSGPVAPAVAEQLVRATAGTPLALVEAPAVLTQDQLAGVEPLPNPVPVGPPVLRAFAPRLGSLAPEKRVALLVAAAAGEAGLAQVLGALGVLGLPPESLTAAEASELITMVGDALTFRHPLLRAVAYHEAAVAERRTVHRALAEVTPPAHRAWHLGVAALAPDERAGDELEQIASGRDQLAVGDAARLLERAAQLTAAQGVRARRCVAAAELWQLAGAAGRVRRLLDEAGQLTGDLRVRARVQVVLGQAESHGGRPVQACRLLVREAARVRATDPAGAAVMLLDAAEAGCLAGEERAAAVAVHRACLLAGHTPQPLPAVLAGHHAAVLARSGRLSEARALLSGCRDELERAVLDGDLPTGWRRTARLGYPALLARLGEFDAAWRVLDEVIAQSRTRGVTALLPGLLVERAEVSARTGDWGDAQATAAEAAELAERVDQPPDLAGALVCLARLAAARGRRTECLAQLDRARGVARVAQLDGLAVPLSAVEGLLELGDGDHQAAYARLEQVASRVEAGAATDHGRVPWVGDLVEAAVRLGHLGRARRLLADTDRHASGSVVLPAVLARCAALLAGDQAEPLFGEALRARPGGAEPFERARAQLCFGEWLRDHGRPEEAGPRLGAALATFDELGARPWARRARQARQASLAPAVAAAGAPPPATRPSTRPAIRLAARPAPPQPAAPRPAVPQPAMRQATVRQTTVPAPGGAASIEPPPIEPLTAQERRVTMLVGQGATNREAAHALFLSPKTIEFHLRSVYRKLGVRSRAELAHLVGQAGAEPPEVSRVATSA